MEGGVGVMMINYESRYGLKARMNEDGLRPKVGDVPLVNPRPQVGLSERSI